MSQALEDGFAFARRAGTGFPSVFVQQGGDLAYLGGSELTVTRLRQVTG